MERFQGYFVDDNVEDLTTFSELLTELDYGENSLTVKGLNLVGESQLANIIVESNPDILFLDFRLDDNLQANNMSNDQGYKGGSLAQNIREKITSSNKKIKDFPIVLVSAENNIENLYKPDKTAHDLFDCCYEKEYLYKRENHSKLTGKIIALINGYRALNNINQENLDFKQLFGSNLDDEIKSILDQQEIRIPLNSSAIPHVKAKFILKNILRREGILLSIHEIAARLGAKPESIGSDVLSKLDNFKYCGVFYEGWERWWANSFDDFLVSLVGYRPFSLTAKERVEKINEKLGTSLIPAISRWTNTADEKIAFACIVCEQPTEIKNSLSVYDPSLLSFIQKKRICNSCIKSGYERNGIIIDDHDEKFVKNIIDQGV